MVKSRPRSPKQRPPEQTQKNTRRAIESPPQTAAVAAAAAFAIGGEDQSRLPEPVSGFASEFLTGDFRCQGWQGG